MKTYQGTDRLVIEAGKHVFKVPKSAPQKSVKELHRVYTDYGPEAFKKYFHLGADQWMSPRWFAFHGLVANRRESRISREYPNIVVPTVPFVGGLVNMQDALEQPRVNFREGIWQAFTDELGQKVVCLGHMLEKASNFGVTENGAVMFVDGGSYHLERMLREGHYKGILGALSTISSLHAERTVQ